MAYRYMLPCHKHNVFSFQVNCPNFYVTSDDNFLYVRIQLKLWAIIFYQNYNLIVIFIELNNCKSNNRVNNLANWTSLYF